MGRTRGRPSTTSPTWQTSASSRTAYASARSATSRSRIRVGGGAGGTITVTQRLGTGWVSGILQNLVVALWNDPAVDTLITALADHGIAGHGRTGLNVWVPLPDEAGTVARLHAAGWAAAPGA